MRSHTGARGGGARLRARVGALLGASLAVSALAGCGPAPGEPAAPQSLTTEAGAALSVPSGTRYVLEGWTLDVDPAGWVTIDGERTWRFMSEGRLVDTNGELIAQMREDGRVLGEDDRDLGQVGGPNAAPPERETAWLSLQPTGHVVRYDSAGRMHPFGRFYRCEHPEPCVLLAHVFGLELRALLRDRKPMLTTGIRAGPGVTRPHGLMLQRDRTRMEPSTAGPW